MNTKKTKIQQQNSKVKSSDNLPTISNDSEISNFIDDGNSIAEGHNTRLRNDELQKSVTTENKGLQSISKSNQDIDVYYQKLVEKKWILMDKIINRNLYKQVQGVKRELFKTSAVYRKKFYQTILNTRVEALHERCDASLKMIKSEYRAKVSSFIMAKMEQLTSEVLDRQITFFEMMKKKHAYAQTLESHPSMKNHYLESIYSEEERYLKFLDSNLSKFESIINEQINKYS